MYARCIYNTVVVCLSLFMVLSCLICFFFFKQKTAYEMRISDWSSDVCSSDLPCEPDLLIKLHKVDGKRLYVLIEAKHLSGKSSGPSEDLTAPYDQLAREWDNLVCRCKKDEAEPLLDRKSVV